MAQTAAAAAAISTNDDDAPVAGRVRGRQNTRTPKRILATPSPVESTPKRRRVKRLEITVTETGKKSFVKTKETPSRLLVLKLKTPKGKAKLKEILSRSLADKVTDISVRPRNESSHGGVTSATRSDATSQNGNPKGDSSTSQLGMTLRNTHLATLTPNLPPPPEPPPARHGPRARPNQPVQQAPKVTHSGASRPHTAVTASVAPAVRLRRRRACAYLAADSDARLRIDVARRWRLPAASAGSVATFAAAGPRALRQVRSTKRGSGSRMRS